MLGDKLISILGREKIGDDNGFTTIRPDVEYDVDIFDTIEDLYSSVLSTNIAVDLSKERMREIC